MTGKLERVSSLVERGRGRDESSLGLLRLVLSRAAEAVLIWVRSDAVIYSTRPEVPSGT